MTICFFGIYNPDYSRNRILIRGFKEHGIKVMEINSRLSGWRKYFELFKKHWQIRKQYDFMLVAFPGYQTIIMAKIICRKKIVFDAFNSIYDSTVMDRKKVNENSLEAKKLWFLNWLACYLADNILLDTFAHIDYFVKEFKSNKEKYIRVLIGADDQIFKI